VRRWDEPVRLKPGEVLTVGEVEDGIERVLKLAYEAAEGGSGEAWLFLGDLYLVSEGRAGRLLGLTTCRDMAEFGSHPTADRPPQLDRQPSPRCGSLHQSFRRLGNSRGAVQAWVPVRLKLRQRHRIS
jgi:hypothetical protein